MNNSLSRKHYIFPLFLLLPCLLILLIVEQTQASDKSSWLGCCNGGDSTSITKSSYKSKNRGGEPAVMSDFRKHRERMLKEQEEGSQTAADEGGGSTISRGGGGSKSRREKWREMHSQRWENDPNAPDLGSKRGLGIPKEREQELREMTYQPNDWGHRHSSEYSSYHGTAHQSPRQSNYYYNNDDDYIQPTTAADDDG